MAYRVDRLPEKFPVGTKFVIEGRAGGAFSRFIEFPDGTKLKLPKRPTLPKIPQKSAPAGRRNRITRSRGH